MKKKLIAFLQFGLEANCKVGADQKLIPRRMSVVRSTVGGPVYR